MLMTLDFSRLLPCLYLLHEELQKHHERKTDVEDTDVSGSTTCILGRVLGDRTKKVCKGFLDLNLQLLMQTPHLLHYTSNNNNNNLKAFQQG